MVERDARGFICTGPALGHDAERAALLQLLRVPDRDAFARLAALVPRVSEYAREPGIVRALTRTGMACASAESRLADTTALANRPPCNSRRWKISN